MDIREIRFTREGETFVLMSGDRQVERYNAAEVLELGRLAFAGLADLQNESRPSAAGLDVVRYEPVEYPLTPTEQTEAEMAQERG